MSIAIGSLRRGADRISIYLPIIMTGLLALGSFWLVRNAPKLAQPEAPRAATHEPDYFMRDFVVKSFLPSGQLRTELHGTEGRHFPDTDTLEVEQPVLRSVAPTGLVTRATAKRALSNGDGSQIQLFGDAVVVREAGTDANGQPAPRLEFRGDFLDVFVDTEQVRSNQPVTLLRDGDRFAGDSLDYDNLTGVADLKGRVRGQIAPAPAGVSAKP